MFRKKLGRFIKENKWIIIVFVVFIFWKFFLISVLWKNRLSPPEPDDSFVYITHIESARQCSFFSSCKDSLIPRNHPLAYSHLTYGFFWGGLAKITGANSENIFHISFYIGTFFLVVTLVFFLQKITSDKKLIAFSLFFFLLFNGSGSYHGFFWVVPSFFALLFFIALLAFFLSDSKYWKLAFIIIIPLAIFIHIIFLYFLLVIFMFPFVKATLEKKFDMLLIRKVFFTFFISIITYLPLSLFFNLKSYPGMQYGVETLSSQIITSSKESIKSHLPPENKEIMIKEKSVLKKIAKKTQFPSFQKIKDNYLKWMFLNPIGMLAFLIVITVLLKNKQINIVALYLSSLIFTLSSSVYENGYRSLLLMWPITFFFLSFGFWFLFKLINEKINSKMYSNCAKAIVLIAICFFTALNLFYSFFWNQFANQKKNYNLDSEYASYLKKNIRKDELIMYGSKVFKSLGNLNGTRSIKKTNDINLASYYLNVRSDTSTYTSSNLNNFLEILSKTFGIVRSISQEQTSSKKETSSEKFFLIEQFGDILIYKKSI